MLRVLLLLLSLLALQPQPSRQQPLNSRPERPASAAAAAGTQLPDVSVAATPGNDAAASASDGATWLDWLLRRSSTASSSEVYMCSMVAMPDRPMRLVGVLPMASQKVAHHVQLFGCSGAPQAR
jgi:hypothetical protein